jgi:hypothetical protein
MMTRKKPIKWQADGEGWWMHTDSGDCWIVPAINDDEEIVPGFVVAASKEEYGSSWHLEYVYKSLKTAKRAALNLFEQIKAEEDAH